MFQPPEKGRFQLTLVQTLVDKMEASCRKPLSERGKQQGS
jgi:hypothetical protein